MTELANLAARLADVVAIPVTPYGEDGAVDLEAVRRLARRLVDAQVRVLTVNGNTGEFYSLSPQERRAVLTATSEAVGDDALLVCGVGLDLASAVADAEHALQHDVRLIMVHQPPHPYVSSEGWIEYHAAIAKAVPDVGVIPYIRNPAVSGSMLGRLAQRCPNVMAVKYSVPDATRFATVKHDAGSEHMVWIAGLAEPYAPAYWQAGARGFTSGLVNVAPRLSLEMLAALRASDYATANRLFAHVKPFEELRAADSSADNVSVVKEAMAQLGLCRRDVRPPISVLTPEKRAKVTEILRSWGVLD
jgi:4-hydroxy-tetrahydrodipicolinate synthase